MKTDKNKSWKDMPASIIVDTTKHDPLAIKKYLKKMEENEMKLQDYILQEFKKFLEE